MDARQLQQIREAAEKKTGKQVAIDRLLLVDILRLASRQFELEKQLVAATTIYRAVRRNAAKYQKRFYDCRNALRRAAWAMTSVADAFTDAAKAAVLDASRKDVEDTLDRTTEDPPT